jgi:hypothetical protein
MSDTTQTTTTTTPVTKPNSAGKLERRILIGKLTGFDITGKPLAQLIAELSTHADSAVLTDVYDCVVSKLNEQPSPEQRVDTALAQAQAEMTTGKVEPVGNEPVAEKATS